MSMNDEKVREYERAKWLSDHLLIPCLVGMFVAGAVLVAAIVVGFVYGDNSTGITLCIIGGAVSVSGMIVAFIGMRASEKAQLLALELGIDDCSGTACVCNCK